jgi:hypothetical protein
VDADCRVKGRVKLFQFSRLGQSIIIVPPATGTGGPYRRENSHSEQGHKTRIPLLGCRFHVRLSFDIGARLSFSPRLFVLPSLHIAKIASETCKWETSWAANPETAGSFR